MTNIDDLIARLKAASEGSRELDGRIYLILYPKREPSPGYAPENIGAALGYAWDVPRYTTSLDAALTLMPEGANCWGIDWTPKANDNCAYVSRNHVSDGHWLRESHGAKTPAIAICIASLKARNI